MMTTNSSCSSKLPLTTIRPTWLRSIAIGCVALIALTSRLALADIASGRYGKAQVFDVQRSPALPSAGVSFTVSSFAAPYYHRTSPYPMNPGDYIAFVFISDCSYAIDLYDSNNVLRIRLQDGGSIYGLDPLGFLHVGPQGAGTFIANSLGYPLGGSLTYTPSVGLVDCAALAAYVPNTVPQAAPSPSTIPTLSEWGMIALAGTIAMLAFVAIRRRNLPALS